MNQFRNLASRWLSDIEKITNEDLINKLYDIFKPSKILLFIDNVKDYEQVKTFLPTTADYSLLQIVIISRSEYWGRLRTITIDVFEEFEALDFLKQVLQQNPEMYIEEEAKSLAKDLGYFPLALTQAAAHIIEKNEKIAEYRIKFQKNKKELLNSRPFPDDPHQETVYVTLNLNIQEIKDKSSNAFEYLKYVSFLASRYIPKILLQKILNISSKELEDMTTLLKNYSIIAIDESPDYIKIHILVQEIVRLDLSKEEKNNIVVILCGFFTRLFPINPLSHTELWALQIILFQHSLKLREYIHEYKIKTIFSVLLLQGIAEYIELIDDTRNLNLALEILREAIAIKEGLLISDNEYVQLEIKLDFSIGKIMSKTDKIQQGILILSNLLERNDTGKQLSSVIRFYIGSAYRNISDIKLAELYLSQVASDVPEAAHELGLIRYNQGKFEEALQFFQQALKGKIDCYKTEDHPQVGTTKRELGHVLAVSGNYVEAVKFLKESRDVHIKVYGTRFHHAVMIDLIQLGDAFYRQGSYREALEQLLLAKEVNDALCGDKDLKLSVNLAKTYISMGCYDSAYYLLKEQIDNYEQSLRFHGFYPVVNLQLGHSLSILEYFKVADSYFAEALAFYGVVSNGIENHNCAVVMLYLGEHYIRESLSGYYQNFWPVAKQTLEFTLQIQTNIYRSNPNHSNIAFTLRNLAFIDFIYRDNDQALEKLARALSIQQKAYEATDDHAEILITQREIVRIQLPKPS